MIGIGDSSNRAVSTTATTACFEVVPVPSPTRCPFLKFALTAERAAKRFCSSTEVAMEQYCKKNWLRHAQDKEASSGLVTFWGGAGVRNVYV